MFLDSTYLRTLKRLQPACGQSFPIPSRNRGLNRRYFSQNLDKVCHKWDICEVLLKTARARTHSQRDL